MWLQSSEPNQRIEEVTGQPTCVSASDTNAVKDRILWLLEMRNRVSTKGIKDLFCAFIVSLSQLGGRRFSK
jgi:hypothetical protein